MVELCVNCLGFTLTVSVSHPGSVGEAQAAHEGGKPCFSQAALPSMSKPHRGQLCTCVTTRSKERVWHLGTQMLTPSWAFSADRCCGVWGFSTLAGIPFGLFQQLTLNHKNVWKDLEITIAPDTGYCVIIIVPKIPFSTPIFFSLTCDRLVHV